jgi:hypothetical protein
VCVVCFSREFVSLGGDIRFDFFFSGALAFARSGTFTRDSCGSKTPQKNERENERERKQKSTPSRFVFVRFRAAENERLKIFFFFLDLIVHL